jgi:hypothetical protein
MNAQMSTQQQQIETNVRMALGDLQLQLIVANAKIAELEQALAAKEPEVPPEVAKPNGKSPAKEASAP